METGDGAIFPVNKFGQSRYKNSTCLAMKLGNAVKIKSKIGTTLVVDIFFIPATLFDRLS